MTYSLIRGGEVSERHELPKAARRSNNDQLSAVRLTGRGGQTEVHGVRRRVSRAVVTAALAAARKQEAHPFTAAIGKPAPFGSHTFTRATATLSRDWRRRFDPIGNQFFMYMAP